MAYYEFVIRSAYASCGTLSLDSLVLSLSYDNRVMHNGYVMFVNGILRTIIEIRNRVDFGFKIQLIEILRNCVHFVMLFCHIKALAEFINFMKVIVTTREIDMNLW